MNMEHMTPDRMDAIELVNQAHVLIDAGQLDKAYPYLEKALQIDPMYIEIYMEMGKRNILLDKYDEAIAEYKKALMVDKQHGAAYFHMGNAYFMQEKFEDAIKSYGQAEELGCSSSMMAENLAFCLQQCGRIDEAVSAYTRAIRMDPESPSPRLRRAHLLMMQGQLSRAAEQMDDFMIRFPTIQEGYDLYTDIYIRLKRYDEAIERMKQAGETFEDSPVPTLQLARLYAAERQFELSHQKLNEARTQAEGDDELLRVVDRFQARLFLVEDNFDQALPIHERLIATEGEEVDAALRMEYLNTLNASKAYEKLLEATLEVLKLPEAEDVLCIAYMLEPWALENLGRLSEAKVRYTTANNKLRMIGIKDSSKVDTHVYRAMCYRGLGEYDKALEQLKFVEDIGYKGPGIHQIRARIYRDMGREDLEQEELRQVKLSKKAGE